MQVVDLSSFILFMCLFTSGKTQKGCEKSTIERPTNADLSSLKESYGDGESARIRCESGYTGFYRAKCEGNTWKITGRACQKKPCGHPGDTPNGDFHLASGDDFVFGSVVEYTCKTGHRMMSRNTQRVCMASGWDNDIPVCEEVKCPIIEPAGNVRALGNYEDGGYSDVVRFECVGAKMQLTGPEEIHCKQDGTWSHDTPTCREIQCEAPAIEHGWITNRQELYRDEDLLRYTCEEGYKAGSEQRPKCTKYGWSITPVCEEITCKLPGSTGSYTSILPKGKNIFRPRDEVTIVCGEGYRTMTTKKERDSFLCGEDGEWPNKMTPGCEEIDCTTRDHDSRATLTLRRAPNGYYIYNYKIDETLAYSCRTSYWPSRVEYRKTAEKATCKIDGWNPKQLCVEKGACDTPTIENGFFVKEGQNYGGFSCNVGFKLSTGGGSQRTSCIEGKWSLTPPMCISVNDCLAPPAANNVISKNKKDIYSHGETEEFGCELGYTSQSQQIRCNNGQWETPQCERDSSICSAPPDIPNAIIVSPYQELYRNGEVLTYTCHLGFKMEGDDKITCEAGNWTETSTPICLPQSPCQAPAAAEHVTYPPNKMMYLHGEVVQYECDAGYTKSEEIKCDNGTLKTPNCQRDYNLCKAPPQVENGKSSISADQKIYTEGLEVNYTCERFYQFKDKDRVTVTVTVTCRRGEWSESPECIPRETCDKPEGTHMTLMPHQDEYSNGHAVRYICEYPYTAKPGKEIRCEWGRWTGEVDCALSRDFCAPLQAGSLKDVVGESQAYYQQGARVQFQCPQHYKFDDGTTTKMLQCHYGQWAYNSPCKKPCKVNPQDLLDRKIGYRRSNFSIEYITHRDSLTFTCQGGTRMKSRSLGTTCYDGTIDLPECQ
ncbi:complement factor H-like [Engraulis encrasicolus]|uniref:complement factor H-like n=1 Tax=Engraulis encrasicolus TaxID=184585 RepID=UPI002FD2B7AF